VTADRIGSSRRRAAAFYETWSDVFLERFGTTLQAGLLKPDADASEDRAQSARLLAERAGVSDGASILDAGSGFGGPATAIATHFRDCRITGITISPTQTAHATRLAAAQRVDDRVATVLGDYHRLPFADGSFDVALFLESIGYSAAHDVLFAEACRTLRPGGIIYVKDVFARADGLSAAQLAELERFDDTWQLAASPTLPAVARTLADLGCDVLVSADLENVGTAKFLAALVEPDPDGLFRLNDLGERFAMRSPDPPLFFGEVRAVVR